MANLCTRCHAPCRFLLCTRCRDVVDGIARAERLSDYEDIPAFTAATLPEVGLPVSALGVRRR